MSVIIFNNLETCLSHVFLIMCKLLAIAEERTIEIYSPDGVHALALRAPCSNTATVWHRSLHAAARRACRAALARARQRLRPLIGDVRYAGWLARRPLQDVRYNYQTRRFFMIIE